MLALSHVTHWCGVLGFHAGWAERDYSSEAIALNREKGNLGMSDKKLGFKSVEFNRVIEPGGKALTNNSLGESGCGFDLGYSKD